MNPCLSPPAFTRITPDRAAALEQDIKRWHMLSVVFIVVALVMQSMAPHLGATTGQALATGGTVLLICGLFFFARARGRPSWLAALGLLSWFGVLVLYLLNKHCLYCGVNQARRDRWCTRCNAPLGW